MEYLKSLPFYDFSFCSCLAYNEGQNGSHTVPLSGINQYGLYME